MKQFKEILFLLNLPKIGKATMMKKYGDILRNGISYNDLVKYVEDSREFLENEISAAKEKAESLFSEVSKEESLSVITIFDHEYPEKLRDMKGKAPVVLYVKGNLLALQNKGISIVGTRKPSSWSMLIEEKLVKKLIGITDRTIISGLAIGCDYIAHKTTVDCDKITVAVLPSGLNEIAQKIHEELAECIIRNGGCLVSEYEPGRKATMATYVERDAIIAALSDATIVIECAEKSGTMHTVDYAHKLGRKLACFYCDDRSKGQYSGNMLMISKYAATRISDTDELVKFLSDIESESLISQQISIEDIMKYD